MGSEALCLLVNLAILVPVKAVMPIGRYGGEPLQSARLENDADRSGCAVLNVPKLLLVMRKWPAIDFPASSHSERSLRALREQGFDRHLLWDQALLVHVAHERLERVPVALKAVWPEVLAHQVHGLVGVLDEER